jgi:broad specificity phosphatase PhoE
VQEGCLDARGVQPVQGNVMVLSHGGTLGRLQGYTRCNTCVDCFFLQEGCLDARGVQPVQGNVMVFPHGGTLGRLEGYTRCNTCVICCLQEGCLNA